MAEEQQKLGRSEEFMRAFAEAKENFDEAKSLFDEAKKIYEEAINKDPAYEDEIKEASKDVFENIRSGMFVAMEKMRELLGLPKSP